MSKLRSGFATLAAAGVLLGGVAMAVPAQASTTEASTTEASAKSAKSAKAARIQPGDTCWVKHDQAPVYHGPHLNSGIKEFLDGTNYVTIGAIPNLVEVLHTEAGYRIGYMQQADLYYCVGER